MEGGGVGEGEGEGRRVGEGGREGEEVRQGTGERWLVFMLPPSRDSTRWSARRTTSADSVVQDCSPFQPPDPRPPLDRPGRRNGVSLFRGPGALLAPTGAV